MFERLRFAWLTAKRAGLRRSLARVRRIVLLRFIYPRFGTQLFPLRSIPTPREALLPMIELLPISARPSQEWNGHVSLLNTKPFSMRSPVDWNANPIGHTLWAFRLHEWEWAYPLIRRAVDNADAASQLEKLLEDYWSSPHPQPLSQRERGIKTVLLPSPSGRGVGGEGVWLEPYTLSRRLVVWCAALRVLSARRGNAEFTRRLASEIDRGARILAHNIEHDLDNNHVIANAKALAFAGTLLQQPYAQQGFDLMWKQLRLQVRPDGTHVENSTSYHFLVWRDAIETCTLTQECKIVIPDDILPRIDAMEKFLSALHYPDGTFPLLNDSVDEGFENFSQTELDKSEVFSDVGYAVLQQGETRVIFDAGALGPTYCPGHGHADTLSFEVWARGRVRIADPGVYQYEAGELRNYFRSTAAHSTLEVDGLNSSEVFGSFRVGRMANARLNVQTDNGKTILRGEHDGYARLKNPIWHARTIELQDECTLLVTDEIRGRGTHNFGLRFSSRPVLQYQYSKKSSAGAF